MEATCEPAIGSGCAEELECVRGLIVRFGRRAGRLIGRRHPELLSIARMSMDAILEDLAVLRSGGLDTVGCDLAGVLRRLREERPRTWRKCLGRIAAGMMISLRYRSGMSEDDRCRAFVARALYEVLQDLLDDLVDGGGYTFPEALRLYRTCLRSLMEVDADFAAMHEVLLEFMRPGEEGTSELLVDICRELNGMLRSASPRLLELLRAAAESLSVGQAATVFLQDARFDRPSLLATARALPSPDPGFTWLERLAANISWPSHLAVIDLMFTGDRVDPRTGDAHVAAWCYLGAAVTFVDHFGNVEQDSSEGIVNVARLFVDGSPRPRSKTSFSPAERARVFEEAVELSWHGVDRARRDRCGNAAFYAFLAVMIPIVTLARDPDVVEYTRTLLTRLHGAGFEGPATALGLPRTVPPSRPTTPRRTHSRRRPSEHSEPS